MAPNRYHHPPCPTKFDKRSAVALALRAARTRAEKGVGTEKVTNSLGELVGEEGKRRG
jgi:hypothetical protein